MLSIFYHLGEFALGTVLLGALGVIKVLGYAISLFLNKKKNKLASKKRIFVGVIIILFVLFFLSENGRMYVWEAIKGTFLVIFEPVKKLFVFLCWEQMPFIGKVLDNVGAVLYNVGAIIVAGYNWLRYFFGLADKVEKKLTGPIEDDHRFGFATWGELKRHDKQLREMIDGPDYLTDYNPHTGKMRKGGVNYIKEGWIEKQEMAKRKKK